MYDVVMKRTWFGLKDDLRRAARDFEARWKAMRDVVGIWRDRRDVQSSEAYVRRLRKGTRLDLLERSSRL
jgi:hypothetical protein